MITRDLIRLLDDVELPSPGRWTISGRQPVELRTTGWRRRRRPAFATGELVVDEDPRRATLSLIVTPLDPELADATLTVNAVLGRADAGGTWLLHGTAVHGEATTPITIDVQYRGVYPQRRRVHGVADDSQHRSVRRRAQTRRRAVRPPQRRRTTSAER